MKHYQRMILAIALTIAATAAYAACTRTTIIGPDGILFCQQCCDGFGNCTITCL